MNHCRAATHRVERGFTLTELLVTIAIIAILSSLTLAGLGVARQRAKADRTETTIRKIHEVVMPHYEQFANRKAPGPKGFLFSNVTSLQSFGTKGMDLIAKRRMMTLELPDGWWDLSTNPPLIWSGTTTTWNRNEFESGVSRRLTASAPANPAAVSQSWGDSECLWMSVMQGGYADPGIIGHFREDEFGDTDADRQREFVDGWGRPIRFLRWAPGFISRYQPPLSAGNVSHDAFDLGGIDPLANKTLFPLIFSMGPDGDADVETRDQPDLSTFSYAAVWYDPFFAPINTYPAALQPAQGRHEAYGQYCHLKFASLVLGSYEGNAIPNITKVFGASKDKVPDDIHNHAMSR